MKKIINSIAKKLEVKSQTLSVVESCTGGNISSLLTRVSGASSYYKGGIIAYSPQIKIAEVGVQKATIQRHTVVSEQVAREMVLGIQEKFQTDYAIATTGNAGPTTDATYEKVGVVYIGIATPLEVLIKKYTFVGNREQVIQRASEKALEELLQEISKN